MKEIKKLIKIAKDSFNGSYEILISNNGHQWNCIVSNETQENVIVIAAGFITTGYKFSEEYPLIKKDQ